jgi:hypothetical protein
MAETATEKAAAEKVTPEQERIRALFDSINPGDRIFVHRVVRAEDGSLTMPTKMVLTEFQGVEDLEYEIFKLACAHGWEAGEYVIRLRQAGKNGVQREARLSLEPPVKAAASTNGVPDPYEALRRAKEFIAPSAPADPMKVVDSVTSAMTKGAELATRGAGAGGSTVTDKLIEKLLERITAPPAAAVDPLANLTKTVELFKGLGLLRTTDDETGAADPLSQFEQLGKLLDVAERFAGRAGGADKSTIIQIFEAIAPQIPVVIDRITTTVNKGLDFAKMRLEAQMGRPVAPPTPAAPAGPAALPEPMRQFITALEDAIKKNDHEFFEPLAMTVATNVQGGFQFLDQIRRGELDDEPALGIIAASGLVNIAAPGARNYCCTFFHWLRSPQGVEILDAAARASAPPQEMKTPPAPRPPSTGAEVTGVCEKCEMRFQYLSRAEFEADSRMCDARDQETGAICSGTIQLKEDAA